MQNLHHNKKNVWKFLYGEKVCHASIILVVVVFFFPYLADALDLKSSNFTVRDPGFQSASTTVMTSDSFRLIGSVGEVAIGTSSATLFNTAGGFLYFPAVTSPVVGATAGAEKVTLSWTASQAYLGWSVGGYSIGQSTNSGGPYSFSSVGNVTSSARTGLAAGTPYYFIVRTLDALSNVIATSSQVSSTPTAASSGSGSGGSSTGSSGGGGGGGGGIIPPTVTPTRIVLRGYAYPKTQVTIFKDGTVIGNPVGDSNGRFEYSHDVEGGIYTFSLYAIDSNNFRSLTTSFTTTIQKNFTVSLSDIVIAPTIGTNKSQVKRGNEIEFSGSSFPHADLSLVINSEHTLQDSTEVDKFGLWKYSLDSGKIELGGHTVRTQALTPDKISSPFSESLAFEVGDRDVAYIKSLASVSLPPVISQSRCNKNGDINNDKKINTVDFSIMLFFWNQPNPKNTCADINGDGVVNLFDFSVMLYWWTG